MSAPTSPTTPGTVTGAVPAPRSAAEADPTALRPFQVHVPDEALTELRQRLTATRSPSRELLADRSQGGQLATMRELCRYWATDYAMASVEPRLTALSQSVPETDGVDIHVLHVRS